MPRAKRARSTSEASATTQQPEPAHPSSGVSISPTPRPLPKKTEEDVFERYNANMRPLAADLYRRLQQGPVPIAAGLPDVVRWMRAHGVRISAVMTAEGTLYRLDRPPEPAREERERSERDDTGKRGSAD